MRVQLNVLRYEQTEPRRRQRHIARQLQRRLRSIRIRPDRRSRRRRPLQPGETQKRRLALKFADTLAEMVTVRAVRQRYQIGSRSQRVGGL